jgi:hypothetical protein
MSFIFILLYAAIKTIIGMGGNAQSIIVKVVVVAILINFSLFFTKVVIDTSNVLALFFYDAIAPSSLNVAFDVSSFENVLKQRGLSNAFMQHMNVTSLYQTVGGESIDAGSIVTIGVLGSIMLLIAAFIFAAVALMFIIRYVVLIFVLILSPIAFLGFILPGAGSLQKKWLDALIGQAFFAPVYFFMTWITLKILAGIMKANVFMPPGAGKATGVSGEALGNLATVTQTQTISTGTFGMIINFIVVITFLIASLIISKKWADGAGGGMNKVTSWAMGKAGGATLGVAGWTGRQTVGRGFQAIAEGETLKNIRSKMVARGGISGTLGSYGVRKIQEGSGKVGSSSLDLRATRLGSTLDAGNAGGKGGYEAWRKEQSKKEEDYAKSQGPSDKTKAKVRLEQERAKNEFDEATRSGDSERIAAARRRLDVATTTRLNVDGRKAEEAKKLEAERTKEIEERKKKETEEDPIIKAEANAKKELDKLEGELKKKERLLVSTTIPAEKDALSAEIKRHMVMMEHTEDEVKRTTQEANTRRAELETRFKAEKESNKITEKDGIGDTRKKAHADAVEKSYWAKFRGYNYTASAQIRKGKKTAKELIDEAMKDTGEKKGDEPEAPATPAGGATT